MPSATAAKLDTPVTGEVIVVYDRSSFALSSCAFDCATAAAACSYCPCASSRSFCDSAFCCASGRIRARFARATSSAASLRCSAAAVASTCAWNGFLSIWNITCPALTIAPSA